MSINGKRYSIMRCSTYIAGSQLTKDSSHEMVQGESDF
jgi:hypothetical protein